MGKLRKDRLLRLHAEVERAIAFDHPGLAVTTTTGKVILEGTFSISPSAAEYRDAGAIATYEVRIEVPESYPEDEPKVFELGNAFPHTANYHCNHTGDCCVCVFETWRATAEDRSFSAYLNGPIRNFFLSQFIKRETNKWPFDEWQHGRKGYVDACADRLGCRSNFDEVDYLLRVLSRDWPRGHWGCPCQSGKRIRECCAEELRALSEKVGKREARAMRDRLHTLSD